MEIKPLAKALGIHQESVWYEEHVAKIQEIRSKDTEDMQGSIRQPVIGFHRYAPHWVVVRANTLPRKSRA